MVFALAGGLTVQVAARKAGVSGRTAFRRLAAPDFRRQVAGARAEMVTQALGMMIVGMTVVGKLRQLLEAESESVRLGAARSILELGINPHCSPSEWKEAVLFGIKTLLGSPDANPERQPHADPV